MRHHLQSSFGPNRTGCAGVFVLAGCLFATALFTATAVADAPEPEKTTKTIAVPEGVAYIPDVTYCPFANKTTLELDIAYPSRGEGPFPVLLILHGQGWVMGSRKNMTPYVLLAAQAGYVGVAINYRLAPKHPFPAAVQDSKCAVRWLRANADKYKIDKDRICAFGFSAGGNLACMLGTTDDKQFEVSGGNPTQSDRVQAVASFYGITDISELHQSCVRKEVSLFNSNLLSLSMTSYLGDICENCDRYVQASPVTHVTKRTAPTFLAHGTKDRLVPIEQSRLYAARLRKSGVEVSLFEAKDGGHDFIGEPEQQALKAMFAFLDKCFKRNDTKLLAPTTK